ncbi:hypothetical protein UXP54_11355 [Enterobacter hormaechei]
MTTQPTNLPVPSESPRDLKFNAGKIDEFVTSLALQYIDRFGNAHYTIEGLKQLVLQQIYNLGWNTVGTFQDGAIISAAGDIIQDEVTGIWYRWDDLSTLPKSVPAGSTPDSTGGVGEGKWLAVDVSDILRKQLAEDDGALLIGNFASSAGVISAKLYGVQSGVDCAPIIQTLQDMSESLRLPIDFSGISEVRFTGRVQIGDWFHWKGGGRNNTIVKPLSLVQSEVGQNGFGTYAWFCRKNPNNALNYFMCEDLQFDGQYQDGYEIATIAPNKMIMMFCIQMNDASTGKDITFLRCHFKNCPHEGIDVYTSNGGQIDGIRMLFCSSEGTNPSLTAVGFNLFNLRNGRVFSPGAYGTYSIRNIVSFGNVSFGHRTQNNFSRGCEMWSISSCQTYDMNDCHHSTDGSRRGVFNGDNVGVQTGASYRNKNYLEIQGEDIDVRGGRYTAAPSGSTNGQAGLFVTDYKYDAETNYYQSKNINIKGFYAERVNASAVRLINTLDATVEDIHAVSCNGVGVSFEYVSGRTSGVDGQPIVPSFNKVGGIYTRSCRGEVMTATTQEVIVTSNGQNNGRGYRVGIEDAVFIDNPIPIRSSAGYHLANQDRTLQSVVSTAPGKNDATTKPASVPYAFNLNDNNSASVQSLSVATLPSSPTSCVYLKIWVLAGSASSSAALFIEKNSSGTTLSTTGIRLFADTTWKERLVVYRVKNSACEAVEVLLAPACDASLSPALTGTTNFADVRVSDFVI